MKLKVLHLFILLFVGFSALAQNKVIYEPLKSQGKMPEFFKKTFLQKYEAEKLRIMSSNEKDKSKEIKYAERYEYFFDNLIIKGDILYGDPLSNYVSKVTEHILKSNKDLNQNIKTFILKHGGVKILSDNKNNIYISLSVLSDVENEAQLAYMICQEIAHVNLNHKYQHFYNDFSAFSISSGKLENKNGYLLYQDEDQYESDKLALDYLKKTDYAVSEALSTFAIYNDQNAYLDHTSWNNKCFEDTFFKLAEKYHTNALKNEDYKDEDSKSSEEFFEKRTAKVETLLSKMEDKDGKLFIQPEDLFDYIQQQTRVELMFYYNKSGYYSTTYMSAYQYQKLYNEYNFTSKLMAYSMFQKALGSYISHKNDVKEDSDGDRYEKARKDLSSDGEVYRLQHLLVSLTDKEAGILSVREAWRNYQVNKGDSFSLRLVRESIREMFENVETFEYSDFLHMNKIPKLSDSLNKKSKDSTLTKSSKLKIRSQMSNINDKTLNYEKTCFAEFLNDTLFERLLKEEENQAKLRVRVVENIEDIESISKYGIDSVCLISPTLGSVKMQGITTSYNILETEKYNQQLATEMDNSLNLVKMNILYINLNDRSNFTTETFNILSGYNWFMDDRSNNYSSQIYFTSQYTRDLTKQYNFIGKVDCINLRLNSLKLSNYYFNVYNLENGKLEVNKSNFNDSKYKQKKAIGFIRGWMK